jgi:hypothetical protein
MRGHRLASFRVLRRQRRALVTFRKFSNLFPSTATVLVIGAPSPALQAQTLPASALPDHALLVQGRLPGAPTPFRRGCAGHHRTVKPQPRTTNSGIGRIACCFVAAQDRLSQTGAGRLPDQPRKLRRRVEFPAGAPLTDESERQSFTEQEKGRAMKRGLQI